MPRKPDFSAEKRQERTDGIVENPHTGQVAHPEQTQSETPESRSSQKMLGSLTVAGQELDGQQIEEPLDEPVESVF